MPTYKGDEIGYSAAHARVKKFRGRAGEHDCVRCGGPALNWAYRFDSPKERVQLRGYGKGQRYSPDPMAYDPMCRACHTVVDVARLQRDTCRRGHPRTEENSYRYGEDRYCRTCCLENATRRRLRQRGAGSETRGA